MLLSTLLERTSLSFSIDHLTSRLIKGHEFAGDFIVLCLKTSC
jgi:hypothetical protein